METDLKLTNNYRNLSSTEYLQVLFYIRKLEQEQIQLRAEVAELRTRLWDETWKHKTKENRVK